MCNVCFEVYRVCIYGLSFLFIYQTEAVFFFVNTHDASTSQSHTHTHCVEHKTGFCVNHYDPFVRGFFGMPHIIVRDNQTRNIAAG